MSVDPGVWVAAFITLGLYSFLWVENPWYRLVEHLYIGISVAHLGVVAYFNIKEMAIKPMLLGSWWLITPVLLGLLLYTRWFSSTAYLSRIPIAFIMGTVSGVAVTGAIKANFIDQIIATTKPVKSLNDLIFVVLVFCATSCFLFSKKASKVLQPCVNIGKWTLMVAFGAAFGYTVMSRISLFTGRLQFLFGEWIQLIR